MGHRIYFPDSRTSSATFWLCGISQVARPWRSERLLVLSAPLYIRRRSLAYGSSMGVRLLSAVGRKVEAMDRSGSFGGGVYTMCKSPHAGPFAGGGKTTSRNGALASPGLRRTTRGIWTGAAPVRAPQVSESARRCRHVQFPGGEKVARSLVCLSSLAAAAGKNTIISLGHRWPDWVHLSFYVAPNCVGAFILPVLL